MSAYLVDSDTIDLLVAAADAWRLTFPGPDAAEHHACSYRNQAGQLLWDENARSVNARYEQQDGENHGAPTYAWQSLCLDRASVGMPIPVLVLGSVRCLRYQSCETSNYHETPAARFLNRIEAEACRRLISVHEAPWGFTRDWMNATIAAKKADLAPAVVSVPAPVAAVPDIATDRDATIAAIKASLKARSGQTWSVTGGRGTAWGWITISAPPKRCGDYGQMSDADRATLGQLLNVDVHHQGVSIAASHDYRREYLQRAKGEHPDTIGQPYWD